MKKGLTYSSTGVDLDIEAEASRILYEAAKSTWENRLGRFGEIFIPFEDFSGVRVIDIGGLPEDSVLSMGFDGGGTKIELGERSERHDTAGIDLVSALADDAIRYGGEPVLMGSVLDTNSIGNARLNYLDVIRALAVGYVKGAREANISIINGEVAQLSARVSGYGPFNYNWSGGIIWVGRRDRLISGNKIRPGDWLVALMEHGFRTNGLSLYREVARNTHGEEWHLVEYGGKTLGEWGLESSKIYTRAIVEMTGGFEGESKVVIHGCANITAGGIPEKVGRMLTPSCYGAKIDEPFEPPEIMLWAQQNGNVRDEEAYRTFNMGHGMVIATPMPETVMEIASRYGIESKVVGRVKASQGISIRNKGAYRRPSTLYF